MTELHKVWLGKLRHDISREELRAEVDTHCDSIDWPEICSEKLQAGKVKETGYQRGHKYGYRSLGNHDYFRCTSSGSVELEQPPPVPSRKRPALTQPSQPPPAHPVEKRAK